MVSGFIDEKKGYLALTIEEYEAERKATQLQDASTIGSGERRGEGRLLDLTQINGADGEGRKDKGRGMAARLDLRPQQLPRPKTHLMSRKWM